MTRADGGTLATLVLLAFSGPFTLTVFLPALPEVATAFASPVDLVQLSVSLATLAVVVANLVAGPAADRFGRRRVVLLSQGLCLAGCLVCLLAPTIGWLVAGRTLLAAAASTGRVISRAVIGDRYAGGTAIAAVSVVALGCLLALVLGPPVGGWLVARAGWQAVFVLQAGLALAVLLATLGWLPERPPRPGPVAGVDQPGLAAFARVWHAPAVAAWLLHGALHYGALMAFVSGLPHILAAAGEPPTTFGLGLLVPVITLTLGVGLATVWRERVPVRRAVLLGSALALFAPLAMVPLLLPLLSIDHPGLYFAPVSLAVVGVGIAFPFTQAAIIDAVGAADKGTAGALMGALPMVIGALAAQAVVLGPVAVMPGVLYGLVLAATALALLLALAVRPPAGPGP